MINSHPHRPAVSSQFLHCTYRACLKLGARKPLLLKASGIPESELRDPLKSFDTQSISALCRVTAFETQSSKIFEELGAVMLPNCFSDAGFSALFESGFGTAIRATLIAQNLGSQMSSFRFAPENGGCQLIWDDDGSAAELVQLAFSHMVQASFALAGDGFRPIKAIHFRHSRPEGCQSGFRLNSADHIPCFYDQNSNFVEFQTGAMNAKNGKANRLVVRSACERRIGFNNSDQHDFLFSKLCYHYLTYLLDKNGLSLDAAADTFAMAERTLRRKLVAENTSFRNILEKVRRDACRLYFLEGTRSLSEIAAKLGYSELSAFTRAYTAWYGHPPSRDMAAISAIAA